MHSPSTSKSFTSKQALLWITIGMIKYEQTGNEIWNSIIYVAQWLPLGGLVIFMLHQSYRNSPKNPFNRLFEDTYSPTRVDIGKTFQNGWTRFKDFSAAFFNLPQAKPIKRGEIQFDASSMNISAHASKGGLSKRVYFTNKGLSF